MESYKKKLEDLGDLRRQVKLLEEKNTMYMQNTVSLEEELRKANAARSQLETYKRQVRELRRCPDGSPGRLSVGTLPYPAPTDSLLWWCDFYL